MAAKKSGHGDNGVGGGRSVPPQARCSNCVDEKLNRSGGMRRGPGSQTPKTGNALRFFRCSTWWRTTGFRVGWRGSCRGIARTVTGKVGGNGCGNGMTLRLGQEMVKLERKIRRRGLGWAGAVLAVASQEP